MLTDLGFDKRYLMPFNGGGTGGGGGGVSRFNFTNGSGVTGTVLNPTSTPTLSLAFATQTVGDNTTNVATTAFVATGLALKANLASPTLTGTPLAPTATLGTNTTQIATTAFVMANSGLTALTGDVTASGNGSQPATVAKIAGVAVGTPTGTGNVVFSASPTLSGVPVAPTATVGTNTTQIATTAFVIANAGGGSAPTVAAYSVYGNATNASATGTNVQYMVLGTPGFTPAANTNALQITSSVANYFQIGVQNTSTNKANSSDVVATADDGDDSTHYFNFGINGGQSGAGSAVPPFLNVHAAYLYTVDNELNIAATGTSGVINFYTTGGSTPVLAGSFSATQNFTVTGTGTATAQIASGLNGATAGSRYVGATNSGAPVSGTFATGDFIVDRSGSLWVCSTGGTSGTWVQTGSSGSGITTLTGDVTAGPGSGSQAATVAKIAGVAVGTPTGTTNVVFSASPTLTGTPLVPTAAVNTNTTQAASTAYVLAVTTLSSLATIGKITTYNGVTTAGNGLKIVVAQGTALSQTAVNNSICTYTTVADGQFEISGVINVTTTVATSVSLSVTFTDYSNNSKTCSIPMANKSGTIGAATGTTNTPYGGVATSIWVKGGTTITCATTGTIASGQYDVRMAITQIV